MSALQQIETGLFHAHVSRCTSYAGLVLLIYDHLLTFSDEVRLVWRRPGNLVSVFFLLNRYSTPIILAVDVYDKGGLTKKLDNSFCTIWFIAEGYLSFLLFAIIRCLMVMRVNALYGGRPKIRNLLYSAYAFYFFSTFAILTPGMFQAAKTFYAENKLLHVCWGKLTNYFWLTWVPALALECLIFSLTAFKAWEHSRANINIPIAKTLYRDGLQYFIIIVLCTLFPLLVWTKAPETLDAMPKYASMAVVNVMASRLVINLRRHSKNGAVMTASGAYEMPPHPSSKHSEPIEVRHAQTIGSGATRRMGRADLEGEFSSDLDLIDQCRSVPAVDPYTPVRPIRAYRPRALDPELAEASAVGQPARKTNRIRSTCPSGSGSLPPRVRPRHI